MKWIGQHIYDQISRFRNDVYLEDIITSTETDMLVVDSDGKVTKRAIDAITVDVSDFLTDGADNRVVTAAGTDALLAETYLTFQNTGNVSTLSVLSDQDTGDLFSIATTTHGATTITTVDDNAAAANLTFTIDGQIGTTAKGVFINNASDSGAVGALTILNLDVDKPAMLVRSDNTTGNLIEIIEGAGSGLTTGNAIDIDINTLTTGGAINIDIDDALTAGAGDQVRSLINVDYDKAGVTGNFAQNHTWGLNINMADAATNHANGNVQMIGAQIDIDSANAQGTITQKGLVLNVAADEVGDAATTSGIEMEVTDGGTDIKMMSSANTADYFTIDTTTNGATTLTTVDADAALAHFEIAADGNITLDSAAGITLEATGTISSESGGTWKWWKAGNGDDYLGMDVGTHGSVQLTTVDAAAAAAHFEIAADGNITLDAAGDIALEAGSGIFSCDAAGVDFTGASADRPSVSFTNNSNDATGPNLFFKNMRDGNGLEDSDVLGTISFAGEDAAGATETYGSITGSVIEADHGDEAGQIAITVANDGTERNGITMTADKATAAEVDVTIANGAASTTTVAGTLTMGSTATLNNTGQIQVASQPSITTLAGLTSLGVAGATTDIAAGDLTMYNAVNDGNPTISIGSSATERLEIKALYASGTQEVSQAILTTYTDSSTGNRGRFVFKVDEVTKAQIWDAGLNLSAASKLQIDGTDIIGDSSGAVKLSNIGLLDATTEATIEAAMDTLPNVTSLGTLTNLDVDDINLNTKTITITGDTDDTFSVVTGAAGATTLTTVDTAGADGHLAMVADGDITLDSAGKIDLEIADGDYIDMYNTTNRFASFYAESGASSSLTMYEMGGDSYDDWFHLNVGEHGATKLSTGDDDGAQAHIEIEADGNIILDAEGDIALEVTGGDVTGDADNYTFTSSSSGKPLLTLKTTNTTKETSGELRFQKDANNTQDSEIIGQVSFYGENNAGTPETLQYGRILGYMADQIDGQEAGGLQISVAAYDGVLTSGLLLNGNTNVDDQVDVTIGSGSGSKTAIAGTIELGHASDTTIARSAAGVVTIEGNQIVTAGVPKGNTFHIGCPTYVSLYLFYMNIQNYWYTPPMYNTQINGNTAIGSMSNLAVATQARGANYVAPRACKVKTVSMVFKQASSYLSGDINLEFQLVKWTPDDDGAASVAVTDMAITDHAGGFTEGDVHSLIFTVTDNADAALAANDCLAFCARTTSAPGSGSTVRNLVNGHINYEIEIT